MLRKDLLYFKNKTVERFFFFFVLFLLLLCKLVSSKNLLIFSECTESNIFLLSFSWIYLMNTMDPKEMHLIYESWEGFTCWLGLPVVNQGPKFNE